MATSDFNTVINSDIEKWINKQSHFVDLYVNKRFVQKKDIKNWIKDSSIVFLPQSHYTIRFFRYDHRYNDVIIEIENNSIYETTFYPTNSLEDAKIIQIRDMVFEHSNSNKDSKTTFSIRTVSELYRYIQIIVSKSNKKGTVYGGYFEELPILSSLQHTIDIMNNYREEIIIEI